MFRFFPSMISRTKNKSQLCEKSAQATALNFHQDTNVCVLCELLKKHTKKEKHFAVFAFASEAWSFNALADSLNRRVTAAASVWQVTYTRRGHDETPDFGLSNCDATKSQLVELARMHRRDKKKRIFGIIQFYRGKYKKSRRLLIIQGGKITHWNCKKGIVEEVELFVFHVNASMMQRNCSI